MSARDDVLKPISGPNPGGVDVRYDPVYDTIKEARREEPDLPQGDWERPRKTADYPLVIKLASDVLAKKSKDLQVAAWLTEALLHQEGFGGLQAGLDLLRALLEQFWEHLHPALEDGDAAIRAAPLEWVGTYLDVAVKSVPLNGRGHSLLAYTEARAVGYEADAEGDEQRRKTRKAAIDEGKLSAEEFDKAFDETPKPFYKQLVADIDACTAALKALDALGEQKFEDDAPVYRKLRVALDEVRDLGQQLLTKKLEQDPDPPEPVAVEAPGMGSAGSGGAGPDSLPVEPTSAQDAAQRVAAAARFLQRADPCNPASYLMLRGFRWGELRARGRDLDPKLLSAPPTHVRTHLKGLLLDGKWPELLAAAEDVMATPHGRGWLDLQRYVLTACDNLGTEYDFVTATIRGALATLLRDLPQMLDMTMMDDTPTANVETRQWLQGQGLIGVEEAPPPTAAAAAEPGDGRPRADRSVFDRATEAVRAGRPEKGIELLMRQVEQEKSTRARFFHRAEAAGIMIQTGGEEIAKPILKELLQQIERHHLEEWEEGPHVAKPLGFLYRCLKTLGDDAEVDKDDLYRRICRLDPLQAIAFRADQAAPAEPTEVADHGATGS